jgi:hypothetical protein
MIIKIKSHKRDSFQKILEYMMNDNDRLFDSERSTFTITYNLKGKTINEWVQQFKENELLRVRRRKDSVRLTHEILSWHRDDAQHITLTKMEDMAREYIRQRNPKGMYIAVPHFDKEHYHLHLLASGVEYKTGKSLRLSKIDLQKLKKEIQNYQRVKFPELSHSIVGYGKQSQPRLSEKEYQFKLRTGRQTDKEQVLATLKTCYKKANSKETFFELLHESDLKTYERTGQTTGVVFNGQKFRFNRLGFTEERFERLERIENRQKNLTYHRIPSLEKKRTDRER